MNIHSWLSEWSSWLWPNIAVHLWETTLFVGLLALGVQLLKRAPASTRYWFWFLAAVKLVVPSFLLVWLVSEIPTGAPTLSPPPLEQSTHGALASDPGRPFYEILKPVLLSQPVVARPVSAAVHNELYCTLTLTWLAGFLFFVVRWAKGSLSLARAVRTGRRIVSLRETEILKRVRSWLPLKQNVDILVSSNVTEVGLWGIWKPTVLLPEGASSRLSDEELEAVILHELLHVKRMDNLAVVFQKAIFSLLWFYPPVWLIDRNLFEERERACDEDVVRLRQSPDAYISGILKVVRACVEQRLVGTSSIGGSNLKRRMVHLLTTRLPRKLGILECALIVGFVGGLSIFSVCAGLMSHNTYAASNRPGGLETEDQEPGGIQGRVFAEDGGFPLSKATLSLRSKDAPPSDPPRTVRTDSRGKYAMTGVKAGQYMLRATRASYVPRFYGQKRSSSFRIERMGTPLSVGPGQILEGIDFGLIRAGVVEGRVVDQDKEPLERIQVMLSGYRRLGANRRLMPFGRDDTDDRGHFRIFGVPPGNYLLSASPRPFSSLLGGGEPAFPPTYYPGVLRVEEAATVKVAAGAEVGGFHISLIETLTYSVSGRVLTSDGQPARSVMILSSDASGKNPMSMLGRNTATNQQGEFKVSGLLPGKHHLYARFSTGRDLQIARATVDVADRNLNGLTLVLGKGAEITGRIVTDREDSDLDSRRIRLYMASDDIANRNLFGNTRAILEEDSTFKVSNLSEGRFRFAVTLPPGNHYVSSIRVERRDITDRSIELKSNDRLDEVKIHIASDGAQLSGVVEHAEGREAAEGATVLIFAAAPQHRGPHSRFTKTTQTDQRGQFSLIGLVPGKYLLCALGDHEAGSEMDPGYLGKLERDSERIDLSPGETVQESLSPVSAANR